MTARQADQTHSCASSAARRPPARWKLVVLSLLIASSATGCELLQAFASGVGVLGSPSLGPPTVTPSAPPAPDCKVADQGTSLVDEASGISLCLPANWRRLAPGDAAWVTIYGVRDSQTERDLAAGIIQDFALPLEPRDDDRLVNLAVYVRPIPGDMTLAALGDAYRATLAEAGAHDILRSDVALPAGPAVTLAGLRPHTLGASGFDDAFAVYILSDGRRAYHVVFISSAEARGYYASIFLGVASSLRYLAPAQSGS
jgi:hypothetical protein